MIKVTGLNRSLVSRGRWYIFKLSKGRSTGMYHQCRADSQACSSVRHMVKGPNRVWHPGDNHKDGWRCTNCHTLAIPTIVGLFTLGFWEEATREIDHQQWNS